MKNKIIYLLIALLIFSIIIVTSYKIINKNNEDTTITKIKIAEVTHSAFYAPLYVAMENDYFKEQGLDVELILTPGADKVSAAVLSNDVEIGFAGAESAIYVYKGGEKDYLQIFSGLTKRDGQFILSRHENKDFNLEDLKGKEILVGRAGGMPSINFLNALKKANIDPNDININYSVEFAALSGTFVGGMGDYVNLFEPTATAVSKENYGYIVANIGQLSGEVPYTTFYARKSYINENEKTIQNFTKALTKGLNYTHTHSSKEIAEVILPQFSSISLDDLTTIVDNYKKADSWFSDTIVPEQSFINLEDMMKDNNLLENYVPYKDLVKNYSHE
ncbi:MAG: ABC transporter substrate-binding protein [Bacilli bacterium]|nr:ABC transporter substrate-binding protein [Bacilli bacterium]